jgi:hypothetical protein
MTITTRFIGHMARMQDVQPGTLYLHDEGTATYLILTASSKAADEEDDDDDKLALILAQWPPSGSSNFFTGKLPDTASIHNFQNMQGMVRVVTGSVTIEPAKLGDPMFAPRKGHNYHGALIDLGGSQHGIMVHDDKGRPHVWALQSGAFVKPRSHFDFIAPNGWRLVWRDGDDEVTLATFTPPPPKA